MKRLPSPIWAGIIIAVTLSTALAVGFMAATNQQQSAQIAQLSTNSDALRSQVADLGEHPVAPPADTVTGEPGQPGPTGAKGDKGDRGSDGLDGATGPVGPAGPTGPPGIPGSDGTPGVNGSSGPAGDNGQPGPAGADGAPGQPGADGAPGQPGMDGQPPSLWTFTDALGVTYTCTRTDPFDPASPVYNCTANTPGVGGAQ